MSKGKSEAFQRAFVAAGADTVIGFMERIKRAQNHEDALQAVQLGRVWFDRLESTITTGEPPEDLQLPKTSPAKAPLPLRPLDDPKSRA